MNGDTRPASFDRSFEETWRRLRGEFTLHEREFWLGVVFGAHPYEVRELLQRSSGLAAYRSRRLQVLHLNSEGLATVIGALVRGVGPGVDGTWVDDQGVSLDERDEVWRAFLRRLNERRDALVETHLGPLLLSCPAGALPLVREEAPDLWSFRSLTASLDPARLRPWTAVGSSPVSPSPSHPVGTAVSRPVLGEPARPSPAVARLLRRTSRQLGSADVSAAMRTALAAFDEAVTAQDHALVSAWLAQVHDAQGEKPEAERLALAALSAELPFELGTTIQLLELLGASDRLPIASDAAEYLVDLRHGLLAPSSPQSLRDLSISLDNLGRVALQRGFLDAATGAYQESLDIRRRLLDSLGERPETLRDLSISLDNAGAVALQRGDLDAATGAYQESLDIRRRLLDSLGERSETLRDLSVSLDNLGRVALQRGEADLAEKHCREARDVLLELERLGPAWAEPEMLERLTASLSRLGGPDPTG